MKLQIFISYSFADKDIMNLLKKTLQNHGHQCYVAQHDENFGGSLPKKISNAIDNSDTVIVILTKNGSSSPSVNQEIGYATSSKKRIIPLIESEVLLPVLLQGVEYVGFSNSTLSNACQKIASFLVSGNFKHVDSDESSDSTEETIIVGGIDSQIYSYDLDEDSILLVQIKSDRPVNVFIVNNRNLKLFEEGYEFSHEDGVERAKKYKLNFQPPRAGTWNVIIENEGSDDAEVDVNLAVK